MDNLVVSFTHCNYCINSAGTEKFVRELSKILQENQYIHLNFSSFYTTNPGRKNLICVNYNDKFIGIFKYKDIPKIINFICLKKNVRLHAIHIHHLINHQIMMIKDLVINFGVDTYYFIHDYYSLCNHHNLINSNGIFCGKEPPSNQKCRNCNFCKDGMNHYQKINKFFLNISQYLKKIIVPSEYTACVIKEAFYKYSKRVIIRPHLKLAGWRKYSILQNKISLAFVGVQKDFKGYIEWKELVFRLQELCPEKYEFYYFGTGNEKIAGVRNVYVSNAEQGDYAMIDALKTHNISCAFAWSKCAETYSYVYYELALAGVYVLTNNISGNIYKEVKLNKNGKIFDSLEQCIQWLATYRYFRDEINKFRIDGKFHPIKFEINSDLFDVVPNILSNGYTYSYKRTPIFFTRYFHSLYYKHKHGIKMLDIHSI